MREHCGDPDAMRGSPGGIVDEIPEGCQGGVFDGKDCEGLPTFEGVGVLLDGNAGAGDGGLEIVNRGSSPCDDSNSFLDVGNKRDVLPKEIKEVDEDFGGFVGAEKESNHLVSDRRVLVDNPKAVAAEDSSVAYVDFEIIEHAGLAHSPLCYCNGTSVDSRNGVVVLVEDINEVDKGCEKPVLAKEENEHLVVEKESFVKTPDMAEDEATTFEDEGAVTRESFEATCSHCDDNDTSFSARKRREAEDADVGARESLQGTCSRLDDNDTSSSAGERKEVVERCEGFAGAVERSGRIGLEENLLIMSPEMVDKEEHNEILGLSPLLTSGDGSQNASGTHIILEVGDATGFFYEDKGRCESVPLVSSRLAAHCPLTRIDRQTAKQVDESCSSLPGKSMGSLCCERTLVDKKLENLLISDVGRTECNPCKHKMFSSNNSNTEKHQAFNSQNSQGQKGDVCDHSKENSLSPQVASVRDGCQISSIARGLSGGSLEEVASCLSGEGSAFLQSSALFAALLDQSSDLSLATDCGRKVTDDVNRASTCCSNVKDSCGQVSDGGMVNSKSVPLIVFRRTNPKRAASLRNNQTDAKSDHLTRKRNSVRKCKKAADVSTSFSSITIKMNKARSKRSCVHRMARKSVWGEAGSLTTHFMENDEPAISSYDLAQAQNKSSKTSQCCRTRGKKQMVHRDRNLKSTETQCAFSTHSMQLKDQICLQPKFSNAIDSQCSTEISNNALPSLNCPTELGIPSRHGQVDCEPSTDMLASGEKFLQRDGQPGDKDIESTVTQDTSCENILGECPGVSSCSGSEALADTVVNRHLLYPESSPDSDIYNPVDASATPIEAGTLTIQDAGVNQNAIVPEMTVSNGMHNKILNSSEAIVSPESASSLDVQLQTGNKKVKKGKKDGEACRKAHTLSEHNLIKEKLRNSEIQNTAMEPLKYVRQRRNGHKERNLLCSDFIKKTNRKGSRRKAVPGESTIVGMADFDCSEEPRKAELGLETWALSEQVIGNVLLEEGGSLMTDGPKGHKLSRSSKTSVSKDKSSPIDSSRRQRLTSRGQKNHNIRKSEKSRNKEKGQTLDASKGACGSLKLFAGTACKSALTESELRCNKSEIKGSTCELEGQPLPQRQAWVLCDDCHKWRCIPTALADMIEETNCRWTCKDNTDKAFAECSIPQEKTNSEINAELEISDASCDEDVPKPNSAGAIKSKLAAAQPAPWTPIKSNLYLHRNRKNQTIDETMVCHCKPPSDGGLGCGDQCLNRMLNIECVRGTCPCRELCSNQQFQKRKYARLKWVPCGKKGFGLQLLEDVSSGQFLIEYVGEVLDFATYEARQRFYASRGQKHFYFMTLNGGEVIDACAKGNLGRFINHSCDPNCRTEKWMVNGEVCIGLFAIRDIRKAEELTFDYNYERVFGAAAKKCVCGSSVCRGYIGGDPLNTEVIVQDDSDDEYLEPMMVHEDNEKALDMDVTLSEANDMVVKDSDVSMQKKELLIVHSPSSETENHQQFTDTISTAPSDVTPLNVTFKSLEPLQVKDIIPRPISEIVSVNCTKRLDDIQTKETICPSSTDVQQSEIPLQAVVDPTSDSALNNNILASDAAIDERLNMLKPFLAKSSHSSHVIKKSKPSAKTMVPQKAKKLPVRSGNAQFEGVEKELNELLDVDGGISKRKDATRGYLKLLFVTAAEGDNVGGASKSIRDLSLILDALLKTKSRMVLMDIINKNGLQMLHNIMKQNRSKFSRIPIIRKLLKVLEFLALKGILTPEHINKGPPCSGMESFKESMLSLTRHNDIQVHQIARSFRDKWIPRMIKRVEPSDRDEIQLDSQRSYCGWFQSSLFNRRLDQGARDSDAIVCVSEPMEQLTSSGLVDKPGETSSHSRQVVSNSLPLTDNNSTTGTRTRKRKSRWDQPSDYKGPDQQNLWSSQDQASEAGSNFVKTAFSDVELGSRDEVLKQNFESQIEEDCSIDGVGVKNSLQQNMDDELPPGFGSPQKGHLVTSESLVPRGEVVMGYLQERYLSHLSVSYGIPLALVQNLGTSEFKGDTGSHQCWAVAPSMPFHPFPPLPLYPRGKPNPSTLTMEYTKNSMIARGINETQICKLSDVDSQAADVPVPSASGERSADNSETRLGNPQITERISWSSNGCGRRFFRPERLNNPKFRRRWAPWPQEGSDCGLRGSIRYRDTGRSFRDGRKNWPPWPQEDSGVSSKGQKGDGDSSIGGVGIVRDTGGGS